MRKIFFIIGVCSYLAAAALVINRKDDNPLAMNFPGWLSNEKYDGYIHNPVFSPDGAKLLFAVRNEKTKYRKMDVYLYYLDSKELKKLNFDNFEAVLAWAPDSQNILYDYPEPHRWFLPISCVYDINRDMVVERFKVPFRGPAPLSPGGKYQMFQNYAKGTTMIKQTGKPIWRNLPDEVQKSWLHWSQTGDSLLYYDYASRNLNQYHIEDDTITTIAHIDEEFELATLIWMHVSPSTDEVFLSTSRKPEEYRGVVLRKLDLNTGKFTYSFDTGFDQTKNGIGRIFSGPVENQVYFTIIGNFVEGQVVGDQRRLVRLDMDTGETETLLSGKNDAVAYCEERDMFAVISRENVYRNLHLLDAKTRRMEQIFPPN